MPLVPLQQVNPGAYAAWAAQNQPGASLQETQAQIPQTQASTQNIQAEIPGTQAQSQSQQIAALQKKAQLGLKADLANKMTLPTAISKYTALGLKADDVFQQYLGESPWGIPHQNPQQLQELGVTPQALGQIGTPGSFMDRYNTKNAISGLRNLGDLWNKTNSATRLAGVLGLSVDSSNYNTAKEIFGNHLSTLIPGAPGGQQTAKDLLDTLPSTNDPREGISGKATGQFQTIEDQLLKTKGYSYKDLGFPPPPNAEKSGGDLLTTLLGNAAGDVKSDVSGIATELKQGAQTTQQKGATTAEGQFIMDMLKGTGSEYKDLLTHPADHIQQHPLNTILDVLPFLKGASALKGGAASGEAGAAADAASSTAASAPKINPIKNLLNPKSTVKAGGNYRSSVVNAADKAGTQISGDDIVSDLEKWSTQGKAGNLSQGSSIDKAVTDAKEALAGKTFKPSEVAKIYNEANNGYAANGQPKSTIQSNIDRGLREVLSNRLDQAAPGWQQGTDIMAKGFQTAKSPARKYAKIGASLGVGALGANAVTNGIKQILGGL